MLAVALLVVSAVDCGLVALNDVNMPPNLLTIYIAAS